MNYLVKMTPAGDFFKFNPPPIWISRVYDPPSHENFQNPISHGVCGFFLEQPNCSERLSTKVNLNHAPVKLNITPVRLGITQVSLNNTQVSQFVRSQ